MQAAIAESWPLPPNAGAYDPLLASLVHLTGLLGWPWSAEALAAGLPDSDEGLTTVLQYLLKPVLRAKENALRER